MNKTELIKHIADKHEYTNTAAAELINAAFDLIKAEVAAGNEVSIPGFGTFKCKEREARNGFNPKTREPIQVAAAKVPRFVVSTAFKKAVADGVVPQEEIPEAKAA